jgi:hypothetical protein
MSQSGWQSALNTELSTAFGFIAAPIPIKAYTLVGSLPSAALYPSCAALVISGGTVTIYVSDGRVWNAMSSGPSYAQIAHTATLNTNPAVPTDNTWYQRPVNTEITDAGGIVSITSNRMRIQAGKYFIRARSVGYAISKKVKIVAHGTPDTDLIIGDASASGSNVATNISECAGVITVTAQTDLKLMEYNVTAGHNYASGRASNLSVQEIYALVDIWKWR